MMSYETYQIKNTPKIIMNNGYKAFRNVAHIKRGEDGISLHK